MGASLPPRRDRAANTGPTYATPIRELVVLAKNAMEPGSLATYPRPKLRSEAHREGDLGRTVKRSVVTIVASAEGRLDRLAAHVDRVLAQR